MFAFVYLLFFSFGNFLAQTVLDNGLIGEPHVDCMEDRLKLRFRTEKPFRGRIFVKGMIDNENCVENYSENRNSSIDFQLTNGECNMRRSRKLGPDERGVEQSIVVIISFHDVFITKVDRAYRCTCFYMEADRVVTNRFDISALPTTELVDTAKMPVCTYSVRRGSVNGPVVNYATIGEEVFHVWRCESDAFSLLVHQCFVDDGNGKDKKQLLDEHGCSTEPDIIPDLTYNHDANMAYSAVNVFKFADKVSTYFQCAVSTCMISEGMCKGRTPPRCGAQNRKRRTVESKDDLMTMDLSAEKIVVLDLEESGAPNNLKRTAAIVSRDLMRDDRLCLSREMASVATASAFFLFFAFISLLSVLFWYSRRTKN